MPIGKASDFQPQRLPIVGYRGGSEVPVDDVSGVAVSPWEPHNFELAEPGTTCLCLVLYIKPLWFLETSQSAEFALSFGRPHIRITRISCVP